MLTRQRSPVQAGDTPLHCAASKGRQGAMQVLLQAGAKQNVKNKVSGGRHRESIGLTGVRGGGRHAGRGRGLGLVGRCSHGRVLTWPAKGIGGGAFCRRWVCGVKM